MRPQFFKSEFGHLGGPLITEQKLLQTSKKLWQKT